MAERSEAWVCGRSPAAIAGSNPAGVMDVCVVCVCCKVSATGLSLVLSRGVPLTVVCPCM